MPFLIILGLVFLVLKLCGVIVWSWFWVLSPFGLFIALWLIILVWIHKNLG